MDKKKKSIVLKILIVVLILTNIFLLFQSKEEKVMIEEYLNKYYTQVIFKEDTLEELKQEVADAEILSTEEKTNFSVYQNQFNEYLTEKMEKDLIRHNRLPYFDLINFGIGNNISSFEIKDIKYRKKSKRKYNVKFNLVLKDINNKEKIVQYNQTYILKKDKDKLKIDYIGENVGKQ